MVYSKYAGTEVEFNGEKHLILKDDDIVGILDTEDIKDLKPLNDRVLIQVIPATSRLILLTSMLLFGHIFDFMGVYLVKNNLDFGAISCLFHYM